MSVTVAERLCHRCGNTHPAHQTNRLYTCGTCLVQWTSCDPHCWFCGNDVLVALADRASSSENSKVKHGPWHNADGATVTYRG